MAGGNVRLISVNAQGDRAGARAIPVLMRSSGRQRVVVAVGLVQNADGFG